MLFYFYAMVLSLCPDLRPRYALITGLCKERAAESTSAEEMAMHRALAEHMLGMHGNKKEVEKVLRDMTRAAALYHIT